MAFTKIRALMTKLSDNFPFLGTVTGTTVADNSITNAKFASTIAASNFSGALPAIDGSALTGLSATTNAASDPAIDTNGTLGDVYINTTSGETYICTDATTDANVWTNVGSGTGNIQAVSFGGQGGGTAYGYHSGGYYPNVHPEQGKYDYANDGNSTAAANLAVGKYMSAGFQSDTHGYTAGGQLPGAPAVNELLRVEKLNFASNTQSVVGNISNWEMEGNNGTNSETHGYTIGQAGYSYANPGNMQKLAFASDGVMSNVGHAYNGGQVIGSSYSVNNSAMHASYTHGYRSGGNTNGSNSTGTGPMASIEKWSFATDSNSVNVGDMAKGDDNLGSGGSSNSHGYIMGGAAPHSITGNAHENYEKFSFSSDGNSTSIGSLFHGEQAGSGTSSLTHCYMAGGGHPQIDTIQKGSFETDTSMTNVGNMTGGAKAYVHGFQD